MNLEDFGFEKIEGVDRMQVIYQDKKGNVLRWPAWGVLPPGESNYHKVRYNGKVLCKYYYPDGPPQEKDLIAYIKKLPS